MDTVGERIRTEREKQGVSRAELARSARIAVTTLSDLELGFSKSTTALHLIAARLGLQPDWLATGKGRKFAATPADQEGEWPGVVGYAQVVGLGTGAEAQEYAETHSLKFRASSLAKKRLHVGNLRVFYGQGDSMFPRIHDGDAVLFDTSDIKPRDGSVFVILWKGEYFAKRCEIIDDLVLFKSDNPNDNHGWQKARRMDTGRDPITIIGRVRWIGSWED
jgi:phage repressor protein C with HTH and peptisase S24 domain